MVFQITTGNKYDNVSINLIDQVAKYNPYLIIEDGAYDDSNWYKRAEESGIKLLMDINMKRAKNINKFHCINRYKNSLFRTSGIGKSLYKNRLKIAQFSVLK